MQNFEILLFKKNTHNLKSEKKRIFTILLRNKTCFKIIRNTLLKNTLFRILSMFS